MMTDTGNALLLDLARTRLLVHQAGQVRTCLEALNDGQLWWRANAESNTIGNLVLHLCGSTRHYIGLGVGSSGYARDRDAEFAEQGPVAKDALLARFNETMAEADRVLSSFDPARLGDTTDRTGKTATYAELIPEPGAPFHRPHGADRLRHQTHPGRGHPRGVEDHPDAVVQHESVTKQGSPTRGRFEVRVLAVVRRIPRGRVATYGDIAALAGRPRAWRTVGIIMRACRAPTVPCHRVVAAGGRVGGYSDPLRKRQLLQDEGIVVGRRAIRHFSQVRWTAAPDCQST